MKEAEYATRIEETANYLGLRWHHETDSRRSKAGFPDYCFVGPEGCLFLEIKSDKGRATPQQEAWIEALDNISSHCDRVNYQAITAYIAYPRDWPRVLSDLKRIAGKD